MSTRLFTNYRIGVIIPTYKTTQTTINLIKDLRKFYTHVRLVVVNDSIPKNSDSYQMFETIKKLSCTDSFITCLSTSSNKHKSGALNLGIDYFLNSRFKPQVIFTCDDDITVNEDTLHHMTKTLMSNAYLGAVCSRCLVKNKRTNLLTRLQSLEYFGFTVTKVADNNFLHGPLVMQGMLSGFKTKALKAVKGFTLDHLIEDYDITARIKRAGWKTAISRRAQAWTDAPETIEGLYHQRVRWGYWGIHVVIDHYKFLPSVFQDLLGHTVFLSLFFLIITSFFFYHPQGSGANFIVPILILVSFAQFVVSYLFGLLSMFHYEDRDPIDWIIRILVLPELLYSNMLSFILLGCYAFYLYNTIFRRLSKYLRVTRSLHEVGLRGFSHLGYVHHWGTRLPQQGN